MHGHMNVKLVDLVGIKILFNITKQKPSWDCNTPRP